MNIEIQLTDEQILNAVKTQLCTGNISHSPTGKYVLVRGDRSGVFCGILVSQQDRTVELTEARHVWYWSGAANVADMALNGVSRPKDCKIVAPVGRIQILDAIEIVDCTPTAEISLRAVPVWAAK